MGSWDPSPSKTDETLWGILANPGIQSVPQCAWNGRPASLLLLLTGFCSLSALQQQQHLSFHRSEDGPGTHWAKVNVSARAAFFLEALEASRTTHIPWF